MHAIDEQARKDVANLAVRIETLEIVRQEATGQSDEIRGLSDALEKAQFVADSADVALGKLAEVGTAMVGLVRELAESRKREAELEARLGLRPAGLVYVPAARPGPRRPWWRFWSSRE